MLKFDSTHKKLKERIRSINWMKVGLTGLAAITLSTAIAVPIYDIQSAKDPCDINGNHAHLYMDSDTKIERYIDSEYKQYDGLVRLEDYKMIDKEEAQELKFLNKHDLFRIDQNQEQLDLAQEQLQNQKEYRFSYTETIHWTTPIKVGKGWSVIHHYKDVTRYSWTNDQSENLTGETRDVQYMYYGYKVTQDANGKYELEKSDLVEKLSDLPDGYNYVSRDFYRAVDPITKEVLSYEDGSISNIKVSNVSNLNRGSFDDSVTYTVNTPEEAIKDSQIEGMLDDFDVADGNSNVNELNN